jgi:hypothetical protein
MSSEFDLNESIPPLEDRSGVKNSEDLPANDVSIGNSPLPAVEIPSGVGSEAASETDRVCRVCHCEGDESRPLYHPCKCSGTIRYIHQDCLRNWLEFSKKQTCELCGESFTFQKVYATGAPPELSAWEIFIELLPTIMSTSYSAYLLFRCIFFLVLVVPLVTFVELEACLSIAFESSELLNSTYYILETFSGTAAAWIVGMFITLVVAITTSNIAFILSIIYPTSANAQVCFTYEKCTRYVN